MSNEAFAEPLELGNETTRVLGPNQKQAVFKLTTSWIPGPDHKGYFRWQMSVSGDGVTLAEAPKYINALHKCDYTFNLYDTGGFVLRHVSMPFLRSIADSGDITGMTSNDLVQMDLAEYRKVVLGSWDMSWRCPEE